MIVCPGCGATGDTEHELEESTFRWSCGACGKGFEVRIVFFPRAEPVDPDQFRTEVNRLLTQQGLTKTELARLVGVTPAYISTLLSGRRAVGAEVGTRVLRVLRLH